MRKLTYIIIEGLNGLKRSKVSSFLTIVTVALSLLLVGLFYIGSKNVIALLTEFKMRVSLEAFIDNAYSDEEIQQLKKQIATEPGIDSVKYISKSEALKIFKKAFNADYAAIMEENPLPASFRIFMRSNYLNHDSAGVLVKHLRALPGIEDVIYRGKIIQILNHYLRTVIRTVIGLGIGLGILSFVLIANNIRLTILAKSRIIETMRLVGATQAMVWGPFFVQGSFEGFLGGGVACIFLIGIVKVLNFSLNAAIVTPESALIGLLLLGAIYGIIGSFLVIRKQI